MATTTHRVRQRNRPTQLELLRIRRGVPSDWQLISGAVCTGAGCASAATCGRVARLCHGVVQVAVRRDGSPVERCAHYELTTTREGTEA